MTNRQLFKSVIVFIISSIISVGSNLKAESFKINAKTSSMIIFGTTNVHNFQSKVTQINGELAINSAKEVEKLVVDIPVRSIKSGEKLMDTKTYEAFLSDKNPNITFKMLNVSEMQISGDNINVGVTGNLTIAGVTRKVSLKSSGKVIKPGTYKFNGSLLLKMTDFKMVPPTAMMGMMKVGDAITLKYDVTMEGDSNMFSQNK
jgi:polyisoprenoid-binding protein YceI